MRTGNNYGSTQVRVNICMHLRCRNGFDPMGNCYRNIVKLPLLLETGNTETQNFSNCKLIIDFQSMIFFGGIIYFNHLLCNANYQRDSVRLLVTF